MNKQALELYIYMNSHKPVIEWLEKEGVKSKSEALNKLAPLANANLISVTRSSGGTIHSLAGTCRCIEKVIEHFKDTE